MVCCAVTCLRVRIRVHRLLHLTLQQWMHVRSLLSGDAPLAADLSAVVWKMLLDHIAFPSSTMYVFPCVVAVLAADVNDAGCCFPFTSIPAPQSHGLRRRSCSSPWRAWFQSSGAVHGRSWFSTLTRNGALTGCCWLP